MINNEILQKIGTRGRKTRTRTNHDNETAAPLRSNHSSRRVAKPSCLVFKGEKSANSTSTNAAPPLEDEAEAEEEEEDEKGDDEEEAAMAMENEAAV